jgi:hypothetical protein
MNAVYQNASGKAARRLIPFLILCYFVAYLDRVNAGFAALTMNKELGLTAEMFGFGVGIFFFGTLSSRCRPTCSWRRSGRGYGLPGS